MAAHPDRRSVLRAAAAGGAGLAAVAACTAATDPSSTATATRSPTVPTTSSRTLLVYYSRDGENYWNGGRRDLDVGNTAVVAGMIADRIEVDTFRIEPVDPYPDDYDATVARNVREEDDDARPAITGTLPAVGDHDTVLVGSPVWNVQAPMVMRTFFESVDLTGKTVLPFVTYAVSGLAGIPAAYAGLAPGATIGAALAVRGEERDSAGDDVEAWLRRVGLLAG